MNQNFTLEMKYAQTVPPNYSWDKGTPIATSVSLITGLSSCQSINEDGEVIYVGYAPYFSVTLSSDPGNLSMDGFQSVRRTINFGDYYNSNSNVLVDTTYGVTQNIEFTHTYIMPGTYTVSITREIYVLVREKDIPQEVWATEGNEIYFEPTVYPEPIKPSHSWQWYNFVKNPYRNAFNVSTPWISAGYQQPLQLTWKQTAGPCFNLTYKGSLIVWRWDNIKKIIPSVFGSDITWDYAAGSSPGGVTWDYASYNCYGGTASLALSTNTQIITKQAIIKVLEIPPAAYLIAGTVDEFTPLQNFTSPLTVRLSPRYTTSGSFPIEKIVWDLGDGSPLLVQRRWSPTLTAPFIFTGVLSEDLDDPRNYDIIYTYQKTPTSPYSFYPSITAYASSTGASDSAACIIGPLKQPVPNIENITLLQNELTEHGKVLMAQVDNNIAVWRADK